MRTVDCHFRILSLASILVASMALGAPLAAFGQGCYHVAGVVSFVNTEIGGISHLVTNFDHTLLVGTQYQAELYILDTNTSTLRPLAASLSSFKPATTSRPGTWAGPASLIALVNPSSPVPVGGVDVCNDGFQVSHPVPVTLRVRAWDSTTGSSWETATVRGESPLFAYFQGYHSPPSGSDNQMVAQPGFQLTVLDPPRIQAQPQGEIGYWGKAASFTVGATGGLPLSYQWFKDGFAISSATDSTLNLTNLDLSAGGDYSVVVANSFGSVTSNPAHLMLKAASISLSLPPGLRIDGVAGKTYGIQYTADLSNANSWLTLTNFTLAQPVQLWPDTSLEAVAGTVARRFYRVVAVP